jgi:integrase/recombinase XerD
LKGEWLKSDKPISAKIIKDVYTGASKTNTFVIEFYEEVLSKKEKMPTNEVSEGTVRNYRATLKHLKNFMATKKMKDLAIDQLDYKFLSDWDFYLMTIIDPQRGKPMERNTANKQHQRLKAILNIAIKEEVLAKQPYNKFPLKFTKAHRDFLTEEEITMLKENDLGGNYSLQKVRDIYLFSVYTGLRNGDALGLKLINLVKRSDGSLWLNFTQEKVDDYSQMLPLLNPAIQIVNKYHI